MTIRLLRGDCRVTLNSLEAGSVQTCITSVPYYQLRSYLAADDPLKPYEIGLESRPELWLAHLSHAFDAVKRILRDDGTLWVNCGDSYAGSGNGSNDHRQNGKNFRKGGDALSLNADKYKGQRPGPIANLPAKNLMMMPSRLAMALQADGWILRSMMPWVKRSAMPESVTDRPSTAVEYWFLFSKQARYYWDADAVRVAWADARLGNPGEYKPDYLVGAGRHDVATKSKAWDKGANLTGRNRRNSDWFFESWQGMLLDDQDEPMALVVNPSGFSGAHFATFPPKLIEPMVKASTSEKGQCPKCGAPWVRCIEKGKLVPSGDKYDKRAYGVVVDNPDVMDAGRNRARDGHRANMAFERIETGWRPSCTHDLEPVPQTVIDPFGGAGTTGLVADRLGRNAVLCELSEAYSDLGTDRLIGESPMFTEVVA